MLNQRAFAARCVSWAGVAILLVPLWIGSAKAQHTFTDYTFVVASGFLCDPGESAVCPAIAKSTNGDEYELDGAGTFSTQSKSVTATGTFTHESANGAVLETGVWLATELISFDSYGAAPGALSRTASAFGRPPFGPLRLPMTAGLLPTGGLATFRIRLLPVLGPIRTAVLQVNCVLGAPPPSRSIEGIRLTLDKNGPDFSEGVRGHVIFLSMRPESSVPTNARGRGAAPVPTEMTTN